MEQRRKHNVIKKGGRQCSCHDSTFRSLLEGSSSQKGANSLVFLVILVHSMQKIHIFIGFLVKYREKKRSTIILDIYINNNRNITITGTAAKATIGVVEEVFTLFPHKKNSMQNKHILLIVLEFDATWRYTTKTEQPAAVFCL